MDDQELERERTLAADNPAMSVPASHSLTWSTTGQDRARNRQRADDTISSSQTTQVSTVDGGSPNTTNTAKTRSATTFPSIQQLPSKHDRGWRRIMRNFSPSWFSVTMGTGVVSLLLINIPLAFPASAQQNWLYWLSVLFLGLNAILFSLAFTISVLRYTLYPEIWSVMVRDPTNSLFLGTIPMGFATIVSAWTLACTPYWGRWSVMVAWAAWMLDSVVAVSVTLALPFLLMSQSHQQGLDRITAAQLLPIAATIVAAGTGVTVAAKLVTREEDVGKALGTLVTCYVLWGMATPMAITVLIMYYQRLALHKLPSREVIVSCFLPLGPLGMGGYAIMQCGKVARTVFPAADFLGAAGGTAGDVVYVLGVFIALIMWAFGLVWFVFALSAIWSVRHFPFNMGEYRCTS
jgi:tellurite resistance protein TehA-like permease